MAGSHQTLDAVECEDLHEKDLIDIARRLGGHSNVQRALGSKRNNDNVRTRITLIKISHKRTNNEKYEFD